MIRHRSTRTFLKLAVIAILATGAACDDDTAEPDDEPDVRTIRLTIGAQVFNQVRGNPTPVTVARGANSLNAIFLRADGQVETRVTPNEFELRVTTANNGVLTFTRSSAFAGVLTGVAAGSTTMTVCLFHLQEGHCEPDVEVTGIAVTVQ